MFLKNELNADIRMYSAGDHQLTDINAPVRIRYRFDNSSDVFNVSGKESPVSALSKGKAVFPER